MLLMTGTSIRVKGAIGKHMAFDGLSALTVMFPVHGCLTDCYCVRQRSLLVCAVTHGDTHQPVYTCRPSKGAAVTSAPAAMASMRLVKHPRTTASLALMLNSRGLASYC